MTSNHTNSVLQPRNQALYPCLVVLLLTICFVVVVSGLLFPPTPSTPIPVYTHSITTIPTPTELPISEQLKIFEFVWKAVNDKYLYLDFNGQDWNAIHDEYRNKIESGLSSWASYKAMEEMIARLGDGHSFFAPPMWDTEGINPGNSDVGTIQIIPSGYQRTVIAAIYQQSPAEKAGLKPRDNILAVDGESPITEDGIIRSLRGPEGTPITLTVQSPGQESRQVSVIRQYLIWDVIKIPYQEFVLPSGKRIGYFALLTFANSSIADQFKKTLVAASAEKPFDGLILDVRMNVGGFTIEMTETLSLFAEGTLGYLIGRDGQYPFEVGPLNDINGSSKLPLVVLVGRDTSSAAEIFAGVLKDIGRAYLIGESTAGNVGFLHTYISDSTGLMFGILTKAYRPLNHPDEDWMKTGIVPDLTVVSNWNQVTVENDPAIQAAIEYFDGLK